MQKQIDALRTKGSGNKAFSDNAYRSTIMIAENRIIAAHGGWSPCVAATNGKTTKECDCWCLVIVIAKIKVALMTTL